MSFTFARLSRAPAPRIRIRQFSTSRYLRQTTIPYTPTCPQPTCECTSTPSDLDIDRKAPLLNTMAAYSEQVILCTGQEDWHSNIEQEDGATGEFVKGLKGVIGRGGVGFDVGAFSLLDSLHVHSSFQTQYKDTRRYFILYYELSMLTQPHSHSITSS